MKKSKKTIVIGSIYLTIGVVLAFISLTLTPMTDKVIAGSSIAFSEGAPIGMFQYYINGLLAGGYITIVPKWLVFTLGLLGVFISYIGIHGIINRDNKAPYGCLFTKSYWVDFQNRVNYKSPVVFKKRK